MNYRYAACTCLKLQHSALGFSVIYNPVLLSMNQRRIRHLRFVDICVRVFKCIQDKQQP